MCTAAKNIYYAHIYYIYYHCSVYHSLHTHHTHPRHAFSGVCVLSAIVSCNLTYLLHKYILYYIEREPILHIYIYVYTYMHIHI